MLRIVCFGDSITYGKWDTERGGWVGRLRWNIDGRYNIGEIQGAQVYNLGIPGETTRRLEQRLNMELAMRTGHFADENNVIIFQVGVNDANHNNAFHKEQVPRDEFLSNFNCLYGKAEKHARSVVFLGVMPIYETALWQSFPHFKNKFFQKEVYQYAELLKNYCKEKDHKYIHLYSLLKEKDFVDGIHPTSEGHEMIFRAVLHNLQRWKIIA